MQEKEQNGSCEIVSVEGELNEKEENLLEFLDSLDDYLTLFGSVSSTLRQGWLELASARHSMGASRISSVLFDLNVHSADTSVQVSQYNVDSIEAQPTFVLHKWVPKSSEEHSSGEMKQRDGEMQAVSDSLQLRNRSGSRLPEGKASATSATPLTLDDEVQKKRSKSLSVFGGLVSPKLRTAQLSFEKALETLIEIANARSVILSKFNQVQKELEDTNR